MAEQKVIEIVTGSTGAVHVTPIDDAVRNSNAGYIDQKVVFTYYENLSARAITANEVRVFSGYGMTQGRYFKIPRNSYQSVTIENGSQGVKRADLIVARYTMEAQTGFEDINLVVIRGQSGAEYTDPEYEQNDVNLGEPGTVDDFPLYRVRLNGLVIEGVDQLFTLLPDGGRIGILEQRLDGKMITDLASESRGVLDGSENVDIGVKNVLPVAHGGTGKNTNTSNSVLVGNGNSAIKNIASANGALYATAANGQPVFGTLPVPQGGTGKTSHTANAVLTGDGSNAVKNVATASGALYATAANGAPKFGTLPAAQGGTGNTSLQATRNAMGLGNTLGALPIANGGTGMTSSPSMTVALGSTSADTILKAEPTPGVSGVLNVANGGTGKSSITSGKVLVGNGSSAPTERSIDTTSGGTASSTSLITSGAVNGGLATKAPTNHASSATTYGKGTSSKYGHVKLTDSYNPDSASGADDGIAASQKAVKDAYQTLLAAMGSAGYGDMLKATYDTNNNGVVDKAEKLNTARKLKVNLASTSDVTFDGSADKTGIGVSGTLPAANGGTGNTSLQATRNAMGLGNTTGALPIANGGTGNTAGYIRTGQLANTTIGSNATAEGYNTTSSGFSSHAEGNETTASGNYSHAEGFTTTASDAYAHAEGANTTASGAGSHAEGSGTTASGRYSHAAGHGTIAASSCQLVTGKCNSKDDSDTYAFIIGIGESGNSRRNGLTVDWSGNLKATSYANISSKRYKENITSMTEEEANKLLELTPVNFDYIGENTPKNQMGLIAEEVAEIMDYPVVREHDVIEGLDYSKFVPALIKLVQLQEQRITELESKISNLT